MTPGQRYREDLTKPGFLRDPAQEQAVAHLDDLYRNLLATRGRVRHGALSRLGARGRTRAVWRPVQGLYFWGGVGRGKTYLMDAFYEALPFEEKRRTHFHRFMRGVHRDLKQLQGEPEPLKRVAAGFAEQTRVLCFDEFFVADITDAMILAGLLEALLARGITLVATSNIPPDELYRDGLQRSRFLPAIDLLKRHAAVVNVDGGVDYRLRELERAELYHCPLDAEADESLMRSFRALAPDAGAPDVSLEIEGRAIRSRWVAEDVVWFDFSEICDGPRSQNDYIELAREFHAVVLSNVPCFDGQDDRARRFINLVDEFYDRNVKLVISAAAPVDQLYRAGRLGFEFQRTCSRLREMRSHEYLGRMHRP